MKNDTRSSLALVLVLVTSLIFSSITSINPERLKVLWFVAAALLSVLLITKNRSVSRNDVIVASLLGMLSLPSNAFVAVFSGVTYLGGVSVFNRSENKIRLIQSYDKRTILKNAGLAVSVGALLGLVNILLGSFSVEMDPSIRLKWILDALLAGSMEEIIFRFFFFALCIQLVHDKTLTKWDQALCYAIMVIPHALLHFDLSNSDIGSLVISSLLFGLPFAVLQRRYSLSTAIGAHTIVNMMRFVVFSA